VVAKRTQGPSDALGEELYVEFLHCKDLSRSMSYRYEALNMAIKVAFIEKRLQDVPALKERRTALGYLGVSTDNIRTRLSALICKLTSRYNNRAADYDDASCKLCLQYQYEIQDLLDACSPPCPPVVPPTTPGSALVPPISSPLLVLQMRLSEGRKSSGMTIVVDGRFTAAHAVDHVLVKVKLFKNSDATRAKHEYNIMVRLHQTAPERFVRPYALVEGCCGQIKPHVTEDEAYCATFVGVVMEKGATDMHVYFTRKERTTLTEKLFLFEEMLNILISSSHCGVVLGDFKPGNVVFCTDGYNYRLKAIDFDNSRREGDQMLIEASAAYSSPEVAREILARARGEIHSPLFASHKMDIMSLGWLVYEIVNDMISYWKNQTPPITEDADILLALSGLSDEHVKRDIEKTFSGQKYSALRTWLCHALRVNPKERASALELQHGHSLFGTKERTLDVNGLQDHFDRGIKSIIQNANENTDAILERFDELSTQLENSLCLLGASLDSVAAQVALGSEQQRKAIAALLGVMQDKRKHIQEGFPLDETVLQAAVTAAMRTMEASLSAKISSSLQDVISSTGPSPAEKLDTLIDMVNGLKRQNDSLGEDFKKLRLMNENQSRLLQIIELNGNNMPLTFVIVPGVNLTDKLLASASRKDKVKNFAERKAESMSRMLWDESRIVFICPVTLKQVTISVREMKVSFRDVLEDRVLTISIHSLLP
jgi:Protein kinase domain